MYWNITDKERLLQAFEIASSNRKMLEAFLSDILTEKEIEQNSNRLKVACMLYEGTSYKRIRNSSHLSPSTIARLSKKLDNKDSGFSKIIKKFVSKGKGRSYFD
jgi:uncharacterized protein YerC